MISYRREKSKTEAIRRRKTKGSYRDSQQPQLLTRLRFYISRDSQMPWGDETTRHEWMIGTGFLFLTHWDKLLKYLRVKTSEEKTYVRFALCKKT